MEANDLRVTAALSKLRINVRDILEDGDDPAEVLALGTLVRRYAEKDTDLVMLRSALEHSTLSEVVGDVALTIDNDDADEDADEDEFYDDEPDELGEDDADPFGGD